MKGTKTVIIKNFRGEGFDLSVDVHWWNYAGVHTLRNGDPGYPEDSGLEIQMFTPTHYEPDCPISEETIEEELDLMNLTPQKLQAEWMDERMEDLIP